MKKYFQGVRRENKKVEWPRGVELRKMTVTVLCFFLIFAVIFLTMDAFIHFVMKAIGI